VAIAELVIKPSDDKVNKWLTSKGWTQEVFGSV